MSVTIRDVAKAAGVSVKTVSRVINDEQWVRADTHARVQRAIRELGFHPNPLARGLNTNRMHTLGLIVPDIANPFFAKGIDGCASVAEQHGYNLSVASTNDYPGREVAHVQALVAQRVAGLILWTSNLKEDTLHEVVGRTGKSCPIVFIDRPFDPVFLRQMGYASILTAEEQVGVLATRHLLAEGRQRIAYIGVASRGPSRWVGDQRIEGYVKTLRAYGAPVDDQWIDRTAQGTIQGGAQVMSALLARRPRPDGLFAFNDLIAVGASLACRQANVRVPEDLAIVGVDDTEMGAIAHPPITTIRLHQRRLGERAAALVLDLAGVNPPPSSSGNPIAPVTIVTQPELPELVVRRSSTMRAVLTPSLDDILGAGVDGPADGYG